MPAIAYGDALTLKAAEHPDRPSLTDGKGTLTRAEVDRQTDLAAHRLVAAGAGPECVVAYTGANSARLLMLAFAIWKAGAIPLPLPERKGPAELGALLDLASPAVAVGFADDVETTALRLTLDTLFSGDTLLSGGASDATVPRPPRHVASVVRIGVSGGSTGISKLISVDAPALINPAKPWPYGMTADGTHVVALDLVDGTGFVSSTAGLATGNHLIITEAFDPAQTLRLIAQHRADWLALTPPLMLQIWKLGPDGRNAHDLSSLRYVTQYSGAAAPWLKRAYIDWFGADRIVESYGATDSRGNTWIDGPTWLAHPGAVGRAENGCEIAIFDTDMRPVPSGIVGDVYLRDLTGRRNFHYIGIEVQTQPGDWETVGDMGWLDDDGYLHLADRRKDVITTREGLVFPSTIEGAIERHDAVRSAVVVGLPGEDAFEQIHALVDAPYALVDAADLREYLLAELSPELVPASIEFVDGPLRDAAGKARRAQLRRERLR
jgi:bile acid-coenzyme A ligase